MLAIVCKLGTKVHIIIIKKEYSLLLLLFFMKKGVPLQPKSKNKYSKHEEISDDCRGCTGHCIV